MMRGMGNRPPGEPEGYAAREIRSWFGFGDLDDAPIGALCCDRQGVFVEANRAVCALLRRDRDQIVGRTWRDLTHPDDHGISDGAVDRIRGDVVPPETLRKRYLRGDGSAVWVDLSFVPVRREGRLRAVLVFVTDATVHVTAASLGSDVIVEWDVTAGRFVPNARWYELTGTTPARDVDLVDWQAMLHPDDAPRVGAELERLLAGHVDVFQSEYRLRAPRGVLHVLARARVIERDAGGAPKRVLATVTDLTQLRAAEENLRHAQRLEALGRLASGVAHDINNLLTSIAANAAMLRRHSGADGRESIAEIDLAVDAAANLTRNLLAFSRRQVVTPRPVSLGEHLAGIAGLLRRMIGNDIELVTEVRSAATIEIDPGQADQMIVNLVVNARDAMPGGGTIRVVVGEVDVPTPPAGPWKQVRPGPHVVLEVSDTGFGMTEEVKRHLFEPFYTTKSQGGTGLGLSTVYGIVDQHKGFIEVDSAPGEGSRFRLYLPRAATTAAGLRPLDWVRGNEQIVVVDDDPLVREAVLRSLQALGYDVHAFASGGDCLAAIDRLAGAQLLLTDVRMPGIDGRELAARLQAAMPQLRTLLMSGYTDFEIEDESTFLPKPFRAADLARKVREVLEKAA
jgi:PAS domain S-box-containing protein